jgi:hypothetical protein
MGGLGVYQEAAALRILRTALTGTRLDVRQ